MGVKEQYSALCVHYALSTLHPLLAYVITVRGFCTASPTSSSVMFSALLGKQSLCKHNTGKL